MGQRAGEGMFQTVPLIVVPMLFPVAIGSLGVTRFRALVSALVA